MEKRVYITDKEREKCQRVMEAYAELYENEDLLVLNAGRYGFVKLQSYRIPFGFDEITTFVDSQSLVDDLWEEWVETQLLILARDTPMEEMSYVDIFRSLPGEKQNEIMEKRNDFADRAGIKNVYRIPCTGQGF